MKKIIGYIRDSNHDESMRFLGILTILIFGFFLAIPSMNQNFGWFDFTFYMFMGGVVFGMAYSWAILKVKTKKE